MSNSIAIVEFPSTVIVVPGPAGPAGLTWMGPWQSGQAYPANAAVFCDPSSYIATAAHTSSAGTEPGVGPDWADVWDILARGGGTAPEPDVPALNFALSGNSQYLPLLF